MEDENIENKEIKNNTSLLDKGLTKLGGLVFSPAVFTVLITALLGPIVVTNVSNDIENKKLQTTVITTVLGCVNAADFNNSNALSRVRIIAQMVNENKEVFELKFDSTLNEFNKLVDTIKSGTITQYNDLIKSNESTINELKYENVKSDSSIKNLNHEKDSLEIEKQKLRKNLNENSIEKEQKIKEYDEKIEKNKAEANQIIEENDKNQKRIKQITDISEALQSQVDRKNAELTEMKGDLEKNKNLINQKNSTIEELKKSPG